MKAPFHQPRFPLPEPTPNLTRYCPTHGLLPAQIYFLKIHCGQICAVGAADPNKAFTGPDASCHRCPQGNLGGLLQFSVLVFLSASF